MSPDRKSMIFLQKASVKLGRCSFYGQRIGHGKSGGNLQGSIIWIFGCLAINDIKERNLMSELIMYIGLIGMVISNFIIFIPRNVFTNGADVPLYIKVVFCYLLCKFLLQQLQYF